VFVIGLLLLFAMAGLTPCVAQGARPQITPQRNKPQENKKPKKGKEPRALGVLEVNGGKGTLIPVAILIDGEFYDASAYKADPIPMALEWGTVYEAEQSGDSKGLFTVNGALHSKSPGSAHPWVGTGTYLPRGSEVAKTSHKAEDVPVGLDNSGDEPPRLTRKDASKPAAAPDASSTPAPGGSGSADKPGATAPASSQPAGGSSTGSTGQQTPKATNPPAPEKPADGQSTPVAAPASQTSSGESSSGKSSSGESGDNYYRPTLRRGKPTTAAPSAEDEAVTKKGGKTDPAASAGAASASPPQMVAAISDALGPDPQSYRFFWKTGEEEERRNQMLALAADEVRAYAAALLKNQIPARPVAPKSGVVGHKAAAKQAQPVFENVQFHGFDVWLTSQPVMILSAEAHIPGATGVNAAAEPYSVMLVVKTDIYGNLRKLFSGITDKFHLDVTPRLELIDVVDADGDGRGELLFRESSDAGSGYLIYRATADKLWKMFDSLHAE
jgi:hypothetical protein